MDAGVDGGVAQGGCLTPVCSGPLARHVRTATVPMPADDALGNRCISSLQTCWDGPVTLNMQQMSLLKELCNDILNF